MSGYDPKTCDHDYGNTEFETGVLQCNLCGVVLKEKPSQTSGTRKKQKDHCKFCRLRTTIMSAPEKNSDWCCKFSQPGKTAYGHCKNVNGQELKL